jgi:hypothetical protein
VLFLPSWLGRCYVQFQNRRNRKSRAKAHAIVNKTLSSSATSSSSKSKKTSLKGKGRPPKKALSRAGSGSTSHGVGEGGGDGDEKMIGKIEDEMMSGGGGALDGYAFRYEVDGLEEQQQQQRSSSSAVPFPLSSSSCGHAPPLECAAPTWQHPQQQQQWEAHHHRQQENISPTDFPPSSCSTLTDSPPFSANTHYFPTHYQHQQDSSSSSHHSQQDFLEPPRARVPSDTSLSSSHSTFADSDLSALWSITSTDHTLAYSLFSAAPEIAAGDLSFKSPPSSDEANYFLPDIQPDAFVYSSPTPTTSAYMEFLSFSSPMNENNHPALSTLSVNAPPYPVDISSSTSSPSLDPSSFDPTSWAQAVCDPASTAAALDPSSLLSDFDLDALVSFTGAGAHTGGAEYLKLDESFLPEMEKLFASYEAEGGGYDFAIPEPATGW